MCRALQSVADRDDQLRDCASMITRANEQLLCGETLCNPLISLFPLLSICLARSGVISADWNKGGRGRGRGGGGRGRGGGGPPTSRTLALQQEFGGAMSMLAVQTPGWLKG